jgi:alpha-1,3-rhamnosyl/mannosyltransferase
MASGVPVLVSDRASLPEVIGNAGRTIDPERPDNTATILVSLLEDPAARAVLAGRGIERAAGFTWAACADVARTVYHAVA